LHRSRKENQKIEIRLLEDEEMLTAIWNAATTRQLAAKHAYLLHDFPFILEENGIHLKPPSWWQSSFEEHLIFESQIAPYYLTRSIT